MPAADPKAWQAAFRARNRVKLRKKRMAYHHRVMQKKREQRLADIAWMNAK